MIDFEDGNYGKCVLAQECKIDKCDNDTYVLPGFDENNRRLQFDIMWFDSDNRRKFECHLPFSQCNYEIPCILDNLHSEIIRNTGKRSIDLVGMSYGGMLSEAYAYEHPEMVRKVGLVTSFSELRDWFLELRRSLTPEQIDNFAKYDWKKIFNNRPDKEYFEYNCIIDGVIGKPPHIRGSEMHDDPFCFHGHLAIPQKARDYLKNFIEKKKN